MESSAIRPSKSTRIGSKNLSRSTRSRQNILAHAQCYAASRVLKFLSFPGVQRRTIESVGYRGAPTRATFWYCRRVTARCQEGIPARLVQGFSGIKAHCRSDAMMHVSFGKDQRTGLFYLSTRGHHAAPYKRVSFSFGKSSAIIMCWLWFRALILWFSTGGVLLLLWSWQEPYWNLILFVPKKDVPSVYCIDNRGLNNITIKNRCPIPLISELNHAHISQLQCYRAILLLSLLSSCIMRKPIPSATLKLFALRVKIGSGFRTVSS